MRFSITNVTKSFRRFRQAVEGLPEQISKTVGQRPLPPRAFLTQHWPRSGLRNIPRPRILESPFRVELLIPSPLATDGIPASTEELPSGSNIPTIRDGNSRTMTFNTN